MMPHLSCKVQISLYTGEDRRPAAGADGDGRDVNIFHIAPLGNRNGEALGVADAVGNAVDEVCEGLRGGEGDEAAHSGVGEA